MTPQRDDPFELQRSARALLEAESTCAVATVDHDGRPWLCNLYYALAPGDGLSLVVLTAPGSAHVRHWTASPEVAVSVFAHPDRPRSQVRGVQLRATRQPADAADAAAYLDRFAEAASISGQTHHRLSVSWLRLLDRAHEVNAGTRVGADGA